MADSKTLSLMAVKQTMATDGLNISVKNFKSKAPKIWSSRIGLLINQAYVAKMVLTLVVYQGFKKVACVGMKR